MNRKILDNSSQDEVTRLFTSVFTSSEGEQEGLLIGNLASELASVTDNREIICFGTYEKESIIGSIFLLDFDSKMPSKFICLLLLQLEKNIRERE
jgi:putative acetyltransferase